MCPHEAADSLPNQKTDMVEIPQKANGEEKRGTTRTLERQKLNPYAPRASDFLSNISNFNIIESTLRGIYIICIFANLHFLSSQ
jgi:homocitrate synthase